MENTVEAIMDALEWQDVEKIQQEGKGDPLGCILAAYKAGVMRGLKEGGKADGMDV